jgi:hypothetical protein
MPILAHGPACPCAGRCISACRTPASPIMLSLGGQHFKLTGGGMDAWALDGRMDAAIVAAMRSAETMTLSAHDRGGKLFSETYALGGAATAMDAAALGCAAH